MIVKEIVVRKDKEGDDVNLDEDEDNGPNIHSNNIKEEEEEVVVVDEKKKKKE